MPESTNNYSDFHYYDSAKKKNEEIFIQNENLVLKDLKIQLSKHCEYYITGRYDINNLILLYVSKRSTSEDTHFVILLDQSLNFIDQLNKTAYTNDEGFNTVNSWNNYNLITINSRNDYNNPKYRTKRYSITNTGFKTIKNEVIIKAPSGIRVRNKTSINSKIVTSAPNLTAFDYLSRSDYIDSTSVFEHGKPLKNYWLKIASKDSLQQLGYVFGAFVKKQIEITTNNYKIIVKRLKKEEFNLEELKKKLAPKVEKITELKKIKAILKDQLIGKTVDGYYIPTKVITDNGKHISNFYDECLISGYFPKYHYLLLECGHSVDHLINLKNGKEDINRIGNPDYYTPSPKNTFWLNGYYSGQSNVYFLEKNTKNANPEYLFEVSSLLGADYLNDYFWINDSTILMRIEKEYYQIALKEI